MMVTPNRRDDDTGKGILNFLKAIKRNCRKIVIEGVIKFRGYKRIRKDNGGVYIKRGADLAKLTYLKVGGFADGRDMLRKIFVKDMLS